MIKLVNGKQHVRAYVNADDEIWKKGTWYFCQNGYHSTGVDITVEQFDMLKELVTHPDVVEFYEKLRKKDG